MATKMLNGLNMTQFNETVGMIKDKPDLAAFQFRADNQWVQGAENKASIKSFYGACKEDQERTKTFEYKADEPPILLGQDQGANPVEYLLASLSSCMTTSLVTHAASEGCEIQECSSHFEGDLDLQGYLGLDDSVPKGYTEIRANFKVKTGASVDKIQEWIQYSPVYNTLRRGCDVKINIEKI